MRYDVVEIESIKLSVIGLESMGISSSQVLIKGVDYLREEYEKSQDIRFLTKAIWFIYAFLEMGFQYDRGKQEFDGVLKCLQLKKEEVFSEGKYAQGIISLSKTNIRNILGKWNPNLHSMKVADAVDDIIGKILEKRIGEYTYHSGKILCQSGEKSLWDNTIKLYIRENETILYNVNQGKYYLIEGK